MGGEGGCGGNGSRDDSMKEHFFMTRSYKRHPYYDNQGWPSTFAR